MAKKNPSRTTKCLAPGGCPRAPKARGLCARHYAQANRVVSDEKTTWDALIKRGFAEAGVAREENRFV